MTHYQPELGQRHRDKTGEFRKKHGNTHISTLRQIYGNHFMPGIPGHLTLSEMLHRFEHSSLSQLLHAQRMKTMHRRQFEFEDYLLD